MSSLQNYLIPKYSSFKKKKKGYPSIQPKYHFKIKHVNNKGGTIS